MRCVLTQRAVVPNGSRHNWLIVTKLIYEQQRKDPNSWDRTFANRVHPSRREKNSEQNLDKVDV